LKIKKQIKKEKSGRNRIIVVSIIIMLLMPYIVVALNNQGTFIGWEKYFAFSFAGLIDLLIVVNILRVVAEGNFDFTIHNQRIKIISGFFKPAFSIHLDKVLFVDISEKSKDEFEVLIVFHKGKRNKSFLSFNSDFVKSNKEFKSAFNYLINRYPDSELWCYRIKKGGAKKYYYLYLIFKSAYHVEFSQHAVDYIRRFMEEYNLS
jgi:hypothetical protein